MFEGGTQALVKEIEIIEICAVQGERTRKYRPVKAYVSDRYKVEVLQFKKSKF